MTQVVQVGNGPRAIAFGAGALWVANAFDGTVSRVDAEAGKVTATIRVGGDPRSIAIAAGKIFVANESGASVSVIDPRSNKVVKTIELQNAPMELAADGDRVWVSVRGGILRYRGGILRFGNPYTIDTFDPMLAWNPVGFAITTSAFDGLTSFKRVGGVEGSVVLPDLAEELLPPTDGGKTFTFRLRPGLKYSTGTAMKASDVRRSFERMFRAEGTGAIFFGSIVGTDACSKDACDLSQGIVTNDESRTVVFHLKLPQAEFPFYLASPLAVILPPDAPLEDAKYTPMAGTGPYRVTAMTQGDEDEEGNPQSGKVTLERNPFFTPRGLAQPDGYADRIEFQWGGDDAGPLLEAIKKGTLDTSVDALDAIKDPAELTTTLAGQSHIFETAFILFVTLNQNIPPFDDVRVRRAINFAIDRRAMAEALGAPLFAEVACQQIPPGILGHIPYCPYTRNPNDSGQWTAPDLDQARRLVAESGTRGQKITLTFDPEHPRAPVMEILADTLKTLGYKVVIRHEPGEDIFFTSLDSPTKYQSILGGWFADFPLASNFTVPVLACKDFTDRVTGRKDSGANVSWYCNRTIDEKIKQAIAAQQKDLLDSIPLWAAVDRAFVDEAAALPYATQRLATVVSARVGNVLYNPMTGLLLTQMWLADRK